MCAEQVTQSNTAIFFFPPCITSHSIAFSRYDDPVPATSPAPVRTPRYEDSGFLDQPDLEDSDDIFNKRNIRNAHPPHWRTALPHDGHLELIKAEDMRRMCNVYWGFRNLSKCAIGWISDKHQSISNHFEYVRGVNQIKRKSSRQVKCSATAAVYYWYW